MKELKEHGPEDIVVAIAGNKNDLGDIRWANVVLLSLKTCLSDSAEMIFNWCQVSFQ